ncbi:MAG: cysteine rich repeat-containing protein [Pseudorhodoplanes sp.]
MTVQFHSVAKAGALLLAVTLSSAAQAQTDGTAAILQKMTAAIQSLEKACGNDIKKFCRNVTPGQGRVLFCMQAYEDKISPKCAFELREAEVNIQTVTAQLQQATEACRADIAKLCGTTQPGQGRISACLAAQSAAVSQGCSAAVGKLQTK